MNPLWTGLDVVLRLGIGGLLTWAGWEKLRAFAWWREVVENLALLPPDWVGPLAAALPGIEVVVGLAVLLGLWTRAASAAAALLFAAFAIMMFVVVARGTDARCGCFGPESDYPVSVAHGLVNLALAILAGLGLVLPGRLRLERAIGRARRRSAVVAE